VRSCPLRSRLTFSSKRKREGAFVDGAEPVREVAAGAMGNPGEQVAAGFFGEDLRHRRIGRGTRC